LQPLAAGAAGFRQANHQAQVALSDLPPSGKACWKRQAFHFAKTVHGSIYRWLSALSRCDAMPFLLADVDLAGYGGAGRSIRILSETEKAVQEQRW